MNALRKSFFVSILVAFFGMLLNSDQVYPVINFILNNSIQLF